MRALIALLFSAFMLAGCGQKGSLYLPGGGNKQHAQPIDMSYQQL
ncbi:MAG: lipoprotein [Endozoicomonas sp. (ex Botrylloides leachii)]|nr:lipoprotein [Endozoicomonas sp. (ex Botrylloides leachii)]